MIENQSPRSTTPYLFLLFFIATSVFSTPLIVAALASLLLDFVRDDLKIFFVTKFGSLSDDFKVNKQFYVAAPSFFFFTFSLFLFSMAIQNWIFPLDIAVPLSQTTPFGFFLIAVIFAPLIEEVLFRGYFLDVARNRFSLRSSAIIVSLCFALLHPFNLFGTFILSLVFVIFAVRTRRLWIPVLFHFSHNLLCFLDTLTGKKSPHFKLSSEGLMSILVFSAIFALLGILCYLKTRRQISYRDILFDSLSSEAPPKKASSFKRFVFLGVYVLIAAFSFSRLDEMSSVSRSLRKMTGASFHSSVFSLKGLKDFDDEADTTHITLVAVTDRQEPKDARDKETISIAYLLNCRLGSDQTLDCNESRLQLRRQFTQEYMRKTLGPRDAPDFGKIGNYHFDCTFGTRSAIRHVYRKGEDDQWVYQSFSPNLNKEKNIRKFDVKAKTFNALEPYLTDLHPTAKIVSYDKWIRYEDKSQSSKSLESFKDTEEYFEQYTWRDIPKRFFEGCETFRVNIDY